MEEDLIKNGVLKEVKIKPPSKPNLEKKTRWLLIMILLTCLFFTGIFALGALGGGSVYLLLLMIIITTGVSIYTSITSIDNIKEHGVNTSISNIISLIISIPIFLVIISVIGWGALVFLIPISLIIYAKIKRREGIK